MSCSMVHEKQHENIKRMTRDDNGIVILREATTQTYLASWFVFICIPKWTAYLPKLAVAY